MAPNSAKQKINKHWLPSPHLPRAPLPPFLVRVLSSCRPPPLHPLPLSSGLSSLPPAVGSVGCAAHVPHGLEACAGAEGMSSLRCCGWTDCRGRVGLLDPTPGAAEIGQSPSATSLHGGCCSAVRDGTGLRLSAITRHRISSQMLSASSLSSFFPSQQTSQITERFGCERSLETM